MNPVPEDSAGTESQVMVVGGGPAGAVTALLLARRGWKVELVDRARFPREKACGECLSPGGVALLDELDLLQPILATSPAILEGWDLSLPGDRRWKPPARGRFRGGDRGLGIRRSTFDHALLEEARSAGVRIRERVRVVAAGAGGPCRPAFVDLTLPDGSRSRRHSRVLVGADGLNSRIRTDIGLARPHRPPVKASLTWRVEGEGPERRQGRLLLSDEFTVGLAPVAGHGEAGWNATLVTNGRSAGKALRTQGWGRMERWLHALPEDWNRAPRAVGGPWGSGGFHRPVSSTHRARTLLVGDAAGYFDPLTGQGIYRALLSARLAADTIDSGLSGTVSRPDDLEALASYGSRIFSSFRTGRWIQRAVEGVVSRPVLRRAGLRALRHAPAPASWLIHLTGDRPETLVRTPTPILSPE